MKLEEEMMRGCLYRCGTQQFPILAKVHIVMEKKKKRFKWLGSFFIAQEGEKKAISDFSSMFGQWLFETSLFVCWVEQAACCGLTTVVVEALNICHLTLDGRTGSF